MPQRNRKPALPRGSASDPWQGRNHRHCRLGSPRAGQAKRRRRCGLNDVEYGDASAQSGGLYPEAELRPQACTGALPRANNAASSVAIATESECSGKPIVLRGYMLLVMILGRLNRTADLELPRVLFIARVALQPLIIFGQRRESRSGSYRFRSSAPSTL